MRKIILIFITSAFTSTIHGQEQLDTTSKFEGDIASVDLIYGTFFCNQNFNNQINTLNQFELFKPIQTIGLSLTATYVRGGKHNFGIHLSYVQIIPQKINITDSLTGTINGFNFSYNIVGIDITPKSKFSSIVIGCGFNTGRLRITSDSYRAQKNPFFAPALFFNPRFFIGHIAIGLRAEYQFDISKKGWRSVNISNKLNTFSPSNLKQSGLLTHFTIGWKF